MALIADSGAIFGLYDRRDRHHRALRRCIEKEPGPVLISTAILGEIDYLLRTKLGIPAEVDFLDDVLSSEFMLEPFTTSDLSRARNLIEQYRTLDLGLADAAVVATAEPFPSRTRKLSPAAPMVLHARVCGRVGRRPIKYKARSRNGRAFSFWQQYNDPLNARR